MKKQNICKFVSETERDELKIYSFVYEQDPSVMSKNIVLAQNVMFLICEGRGEIAVNAESYGFESGDIIFGFEGDSFSVSTWEKTEYMYISFSGKRTEELFKRFAVSEENRHFRGYGALVPLWKNALSLAESNVDLAAESMLLYAFSRLTADTVRNNMIVSRIVEITEENFSDSTLSIGAIAEDMGYNSKYLSHIFKKEKGISYTEYLRNHRIKYAITLLNFGIDSVKNVAYLSGFSDPLYFSSVFKKVTGQSPKEYRESKTV